MQLDKLQIEYVKFIDTYETSFARVDKYKNFRIIACTSESCRLYVQWSCDGHEVCLDNSIILPKNKWASDKLEVAANYCRIKVICDQPQVVVDRLIVNVIGRK